jgi:hypothetical protein
MIDAHVEAFLNGGNAISIIRVESCNSGDWPAAQGNWRNANISAPEKAVSGFSIGCH